jgi:hypothetical protein
MNAWATRAARSGLAVGLRALALLGAGAALWAGGCATGQTAPGEYLTLRTEGATWQMYLEPSGRVSGADFELVATDTGYRGLLHGHHASMSENDGRIVGTRGGRAIDLHVAAAGEAISATGTFAGRLGRVELGPGELTSSLGPCTVVLERRDEHRYVGKRNCRGSVRFTHTEIELPQAFDQLSPPRKVMLLAALTGA